jgi:CO/xanthine dehydrogenase FAD-binding subunit
VLGVAADLKTCTEARITVGSVLPGPFRARKAEDALVGNVLDGNLISEIARQAGDETAPLPHHGFSRAYLSECLKIYTHRALSLAAERVGN